METKENYMEKDCCNHHSIWRCAGFGVLGLFGFAAFLLIGGAIIMALWNWLLPSLFNFISITFWQAVGLALLARLLFGSSHCRWHRMDRRGMWHAYHGGHGFHAHHFWKSKGWKNENCRNYYHSWQHYDKFWEEEGEKAFQEYVKKKGESSEKSQDNIV
jgi:hypothetical protein